jgi:hypothetical protein
MHHQCRRSMHRSILLRGLGHQLWFRQYRSLTKAWRVVGEKSRRVRFTLGRERGRGMNVEDDDWGWSFLGQPLSLMPDGRKALATSVPSFCGPVAVGLSQLSTEKLDASELFRQNQVSGN